MNKPKVYVTRHIPERGLELIKENFQIDIWPEYYPPSKEDIIKEAKKVDALVTLVTDSINREVLKKAKNLRVVAQLAVGFDNIDLKECTRRGIYVTNTPGVLTETVADFAWCLILAVSRRVIEADKFVKSGEWDKTRTGWHPKMFLGRDVHGKTLGIVGLGKIGEAVAKRAKGFNMELIYYDPRRKEKKEIELDAKYVDFHTVMKESNFISLHVPLNHETHHLIGENELRLMKETAFLINTSRGPIVDEKALYKALKNGWIAGAALDVHEQEPTPGDNPLLQLENVVVAPHVASSSHETRSKMAEMVAQNLLVFFKGEVPPNLVNTNVLKIRKPEKII